MSNWIWFTAGVGVGGVIVAGVIALLVLIAELQAKKRRKQWGWE